MTTTKQTAKAIKGLLEQVGGFARTEFLIKKFGEVGPALDLLVSQGAIIRVRGVGAHVELA